MTQMFYRAYHITGNNISKNDISGDAYGTDDDDQHSSDIEFFGQVCIIHGHSQAERRKIKLCLLYSTSGVNEIR